MGEATDAVEVAGKVIADLEVDEGVWVRLWVWVGVGGLALITVVQS